VSIGNKISQQWNLSTTDDPGNAGVESGVLTSFRCFGLDNMGLHQTLIKVQLAPKY
jgi:hypothetical protein